MLGNYDRRRFQRRMLAMLGSVVLATANQMLPKIVTCVAFHPIEPAGGDAILMQQICLCVPQCPLW